MKNLTKLYKGVIAATMALAVVAAISSYAAGPERVPVSTPTPSASPVVTK